MRKLLPVILAVCVCLCCVSVRAETDTEIPVTLCYSGEVYAVDYVFSVSGDADIRGAACGPGIMLDWNCIASEGRLYISLASGRPIPPAKHLLTVTASAGTTLQLESVAINGVRRDDVFSAHTGEEIPAVPPTYDSEGWTAGVKCAHCGYVSVQPQPVPALTPEVEIFFAADDSITVSGKLSDTADVRGHTVIEILSAQGTILHSEDITQLDLRAFSVRLEDCAGASSVRITRLDAETGALLRELYCAAVYPLGDANRDGKTDSNDAVAILRKLAGY